MPNAPFLAPERDTASKLGRVKRASVAATYTVPGTTYFGATTWTPSTGGPNTDTYFPMYARSPIMVLDIAAQISTLETTKNFRMGLYAADGDYQPIGAPLMDSGDISTATTGIKTYTPTVPVLVPRGRFLSVLNTSATGTAVWRAYQCALVGGAFATALGTTPYLADMSVGRTYAAFPTPGTAWTTDNFDSSVPIAIPIVIHQVAP